MACLDTTLLVDLLRPHAARKRGAIEKIEALARRGETLATTRVNVAELYVGIERSDDPQRDAGRVRKLLDYMDIVLEFDDAAAQEFGRVMAHLQRIGRPAGDMDVLIAATALAHGHCLVTRNPGHFAGIPHLEIEGY
jgi:predicted nucleic acid-binding protein